MKVELYNNSIIFRATDRQRTERGTEYLDDFTVDDAVERFQEALTAGRTHTLISRERVMAPTGLIDVALADVEGVPGNANPSILATEGWRGTTDDVAVYAHGLVRITDVRRLKNGYGYRVAFKNV